MILSKAMLRERKLRFRRISAGARVMAGTVRAVGGVSASKYSPGDAGANDAGTVKRRLESRVTIMVGLSHLYFRGSIGTDVRTSGDDPKGLLRAAVADLLPPEQLGAPKRGFVFPLERWLRTELRPLVERLLSPERLQAQGIFNPRFDFASLEADRLWPLLMFQLWHLLYVEEALSDAPTFSWRDVAANPAGAR